MTEPIETTSANSTDKNAKTQPTAETIKHIRHQIEERIPQVQEKIFKKSGIENPNRRVLINAAGEQLRQEKISDYDVDTGLLNRLGYKKQKELAKKQAAQTGMQMATAVIDLDDLKLTNDTLGHKAGDKLIKDMADLLRSTSRADDILARVGGDEFNIILLNTSSEQALAWSKRIMAQMMIKKIKASIGINPVNGSDIDASIEEADKLMYEEKRNHKTKPGLSRRIGNKIRTIFGR